MENKELNKAVAAILKSGDREALAEFIIEYVQPGHITIDFVSMLLNSRALKEGDALVKKMRKGIEVRTLVPGSVHLASEVTVSERMNYILDGADVKVTYNEWDIENGDIGTINDLRSEMVLKLRDFYMNKVFSALTSVWTAVNTPSNFVTVGGPITDTVLEAAIDQINETVGKVRAVVGTRSALSPITKFGAFWNDGATTPTVVGVPSQIEKVVQDGFLGRYYGAQLIALDQQWDNPEDNNTLIPTDKILVIGENVGEFITYGEPKWKNWTDMNPTPPQGFIEVYQRFGMIIDKAQGIYVIGGLT